MWKPEHIFTFGQNARVICDDNEKPHLIITHDSIGMYIFFESRDRNDAARKMVLKMIQKKILYFKMFQTSGQISNNLLVKKNRSEKTSGSL